MINIVHPESNNILYFDMMIKLFVHIFQKMINIYTSKIIWDYSTLEYLVL